MKSLGVGIIILNKTSFHMSFYGCINPRVFFTKDLQQYLVYKNFQNDGYSGFDDLTLPDAEVDSTFSWYLRS